MKYIDIHTMPKFRFAHEYSAESYHNNFGIADSVIEITYLVEGSFSVEKYGEKQIVRAGDVICNLYDGVLAVSTTEFHRHRTVCVDASWVYSENQSNALCVPRIIRKGVGSEAITDMIDDFVVKSYRYSDNIARCAGAFLELLFCIDKVSTSNGITNNSETSILARRAKKYIQKNIHLPITQAQVAEYLDISPGHLCSVFKKSEGVTLMKYINSIKLKNIRGLVESKKMKLYEAAEMYGYSDANYVSALYTKMFGHNITDTSFSFKHE